MSFDNFYNTEYLSERLSAVCKERDELKRELKEANLCLLTYREELERQKAMSLLGSNVRGSNQKEEDLL